MSYIDDCKATHAAHLEYGLLASAAETLAHGSWRLAAAVRCIRPIAGIAIGTAMSIRCAATTAAVAAAAELVRQCV